MAEARFYSESLIPDDLLEKAVHDLGLPPENPSVRYAARALFKAYIYREQAKKQRTERKKEVYDDITELLNGRTFRMRANREFRRIDPTDRRGFQPTNALIVHYDVIGQKWVNDKKGHEAGNINLFNAGQIVKGVARQRDLTSRIGGDELAGVYFFRDDIVKPKDMAELVNGHLGKEVTEAIEQGKISGLRWCSTFFEEGKYIRQLLSEADPTPEVNPHRVIEIWAGEVPRRRN